MVGDPAAAAASQAEVAAAVILHELGSGAVPLPRCRSACWSAIAEGDAVAEFASGPDGRPTAVWRPISQIGEGPDTRRANWADAFACYPGLVADVLG